jgi:hypothetical protein
MLNTFEGQKQLLAGSLETLAIVAGEPFAQVFKPLVTIVVEVVNAVLNVFRQLPAPVKRAFAAFVVGAGAVVALVGAVIAAQGGLRSPPHRAQGGGDHARRADGHHPSGDPHLRRARGGGGGASSSRSAATSAASPTSSPACGTASSLPSEGSCSFSSRGASPARCARS